VRLVGYLKRKMCVRSLQCPKHFRFHVDALDLSEDSSTLEASALLGC